MIKAVAIDSSIEPSEDQERHGRGDGAPFPKVQPDPPAEPASGTRSHLRVGLPSAAPPCCDRIGRIFRRAKSLAVCSAPMQPLAEALGIMLGGARTGIKTVRSGANHADWCCGTGSGQPGNR
jgi:hypothetical protein